MILFILLLVIYLAIIAYDYKYLTDIKINIED